MTLSRRIFRALFFGAETGTILGAILFMSIAGMTAHPRNSAFDQLGSFVFAMLILLVVASLCLIRTDGRLARVGLLTASVIFVSGVLFPAM